MKKTILAALAIAGFAAVNNAKAVTFATNDAVMFFYIQQSASSSTPGYNTNVAIDLGNLRGYGVGQTSTFTYNDLSIVSSTFGTNWYNNADLFVGVIQATTSSALTSFADGQYTAMQVNRIFSKQNTVITQLRKGTISSINGSAATAMPINQGPGIAANYNLYDDPSQTIDPNQTYFNGYIGGQLGQSMIGGGQDIALYTYNATANDGTQIGAVSISASGDVTVVPEPSTYALIGLGALLLVVAYRRKSNA